MLIFKLGIRNIEVTVMHYRAEERIKEMMDKSLVSLFFTHFVLIYY